MSKRSLQQMVVAGAFGLVPSAASAAPVAVHRLDVWDGITIGASLGLLLFASLGNLLLALATRQRAYGYYALWAAMVPGWGVLETRLATLLIPDLNGEWTRSLASLFVVLAVACAALGLRSALTDLLPAWLIRAIDVATMLLLGAGIVNMLPGSPLASPQSNVLQIMTLIGVALAAIACWHAWPRDAARDFALSFTIPTIAMVGTFDLPPLLPIFAEGTGDFVVLIACALQALCLMLVAAQRLLRTASERDSALSTGRRMAILAEQDPLTNLLNRRGFVIRAERLLAAPTGASLVLLDLDHFKAVNDNHGHDVGDALLCAIAKALSRVAIDGLVGRMGGEEFAVAAPAHVDAMGLAEQARRAISEVRLVDSHPELGVTASAGVALLPSGHGFPTAYRLADRALIAAKRQGRDRVCLATEDEAAPLFARH